jgi:disulfide bond formation protein DsbB
VSADDLLAQIMAAPLVRCDDIPWQLAGISMAGWNAIVSIVLCGLWLMALKRR